MILRFGSNVFVYVLLFVFAVVIIILEMKIIKLEDSKDQLETTVGRLLRANTVIQNAGLVNPLLDAKRSDRDMLVMYNRVPKTGSTSFVNVAYDLCKRNRFNVLHLNITGNMHVMSIADQARFVRNVTQWYAKKPGLYHGHVGFINFAKLTCFDRSCAIIFITDRTGAIEMNMIAQERSKHVNLKKFGVSQKPVYINLLRKPLDRLVSYYYFLRYGDDYRPHLVRRKHGDKMTFDECVEKRQPDCNPENMWLQIPFLCGHAADCWEPGNSWALEEAKRNLLNHYLVVGVTEELSDFIAILEATLPTFFHGAVEHFKSSKKAHLRKTNQKIEPLEETVATIQKTRIWRMENELYEFALEQFRFLKKRMGADASGDIVDKGQQFMFEKIIPK